MISSLLNGFGYEEHRVSKFEKTGDNTYRITIDNANVDAYKSSLSALSIKSAKSVMTVTFKDGAIKSVSAKLEIECSLDSKVTVTRDLEIKK